MYFALFSSGQQTQQKPLSIVYSIISMVQVMGNELKQILENQRQLESEFESLKLDSSDRGNLREYAHNVHITTQGHYTYTDSHIHRHVCTHSIHTHTPHQSKSQHHAGNAELFLNRTTGTLELI